MEVVNPAREDLGVSNGRKMPLHLVRDATPEMRVMQEEIFGPVLPIATYRTVDDAIDRVNRGDRPLGLYYFGQDKGEEATVLDRTVSGGVTVNDVIFHTAMEDLPFGGIGPSGMGAYHGHDGFKTFSHAKAVYRQPKLDVAKLAGFKPPYGSATTKAIAKGFGGIGDHRRSLHSLLAGRGWGWVRARQREVRRLRYVRRVQELACGSHPPPAPPLQGGEWFRSGVRGGGPSRNRTGVRGFAVLCVTTPPSGPGWAAALAADQRVEVNAPDWSRLHPGCASGPVR